MHEVRSVTIKKELAGRASPLQPGATRKADCIRLLAETVGNC